MPGTSDGIPEWEWDVVRKLCDEIMYAVDSEDDELEVVKKKDLFKYLDELTMKYGESPSILSTRAEFSSSDLHKIELLKRAFEIADARHDLPNLTFISSSLAQVYIEDLRDKAEGRRWLSALQICLESYWDDDEAEEYNRLDSILQG